MHGQRGRAVEKFCDVVALLGVARTMALGFKTDEIRRTFNVGEVRPLFPH